MAMASHDVGENALFTARAMLSAEPFTVPPRGYPLLLQTGETFHGEPLHDTQHFIAADRFADGIESLHKLAQDTQYFQVTASLLLAGLQ